MSKSTTETKAANPSAGYLPVLPDGWTYTVTISDPRGVSIVTVVPDVGASEPNRYVVGTDGPDGNTRSTHVDSLRDGVKIAAKNVRALDLIEQEETRIREARQEALLSLGEVTGGGEPALSED